MDDYSRAVSILRRVKALGVRIAMDDFGTGYSSLSYLQSFPFDKIKIDQTFISNLDRNAAKRRDRACRARSGPQSRPDDRRRGVETTEQLTILRNEGCDEIQGYLIGRPQPIDGICRNCGPFYWENAHVSSPPDEMRRYCNRRLVPASKIIPSDGPMFFIKLSRFASISQTSPRGRSSQNHSENRWPAPPACAVGDVVGMKLSTFYHWCFTYCLVHAIRFRGCQRSEQPDQINPAKIHVTSLSEDEAGEEFGNSDDRSRFR